MAWKQFQFKEQTVFVRVLATGKPIVHRGRVEMRYRLGATKSYRAAPDNLIEVEGGEIFSDDAFGGAPVPAVASQAVREDPVKAAGPETIIIHTDGACSGNPGPAGIGVFIERPDGEIIERCTGIRLQRLGFTVGRSMTTMETKSSIPMAILW